MGKTNISTKIFVDKFLAGSAFSNFKARSLVHTYTFEVFIINYFVPHALLCRFHLSIPRCFHSQTSLDVISHTKMIKGAWVLMHFAYRSH